MFYNPMSAAPTPVRAWLEAAERLRREGERGGCRVARSDNSLGTSGDSFVRRALCRVLARM